MNVGQLRKLLEGLPDDRRVLVPSHDHSYRDCQAERCFARYEGHNNWGEDFGGTKEFPEDEFGIRMPVIVVH